jgi:hypothetical protein
VYKGHGGNTSQILDISSSWRLVVSFTVLLHNFTSTERTCGIHCVGVLVVARAILDVVTKRERAQTVLRTEVQSSDL